MLSLQVVSTGQSLSLDWVHKFVKDNHKKYEQGGFLATWEEVDFDEEESDIRYLVSHPSTLRLGSTEQICVELFDQSSGAEISAEVHSFKVHQSKKFTVFNTQSVGTTSMYTGKLFLLSTGFIKIRNKESLSGSHFTMDRPRRQVHPCIL